MVDKCHRKPCKCGAKISWDTIMGNATQQIEKSYPSQFYRLPHIKAMLGVSGSSIWAWVRQGKFPKPVKLAENTTAWNAEDIEIWIQSRIASSKQENKL